jgi:ribA/ribD-fused uncharacterized protein
MMGKKRTLPLRVDWEEVKVDIMEEALMAKFGQNSDIRDVLLSTQDKFIAEHTARDKYWGDGGKKGTGKNMLGRLLMKVRTRLRTSLAERSEAV